MPSVTIHALRQQAIQAFASVTDCPSLEADLLLAFVLKQPRSTLFAWPEKIVPEETSVAFLTCLARRLRNEPIAYITGQREFWSLDLSVNPDTLIPRPETELLVEMILTFFPAMQGVKVADLGTGSGAIALALASMRPHWQICGTDAQVGALNVARRNSQQCGLGQVAFYQGSWCDALPSREFDVIVSNPPYLSEAEWQHGQQGLRFEPKTALVSGPTGLEAIEAILQQAMAYLKPNGILLIEHGFLQGPAVRQLFTQAGYQGVRSQRDLAGKERVTMGVR